MKKIIFIFLSILPLLAVSQSAGQIATGMKLDNNNYIVITNINPSDGVIYYDIYRIKAERTYELQYGKMEDFKCKITEFYFGAPIKKITYDTTLTYSGNLNNTAYKILKRDKFGNGNIDFINEPNTTDKK